MRFVLAVTLALWVGCSAISYHRDIDRPAEAEIRAAHLAGAEQRAPYYYTLALAYLYRAREHGARSDYGSARLFGEKAQDAAKKARAQAIGTGSPP